MTEDGLPQKPIETHVVSGMCESPECDNRATVVAPNGYVCRGCAVTRRGGVDD